MGDTFTLLFYLSLCAWQNYTSVLLKFTCVTHFHFCFKLTWVRYPHFCFTELYMRGTFTLVFYLSLHARVTHLHFCFTVKCSCLSHDALGRCSNALEVETRIDKQLTWTWCSDVHAKPWWTQIMHLKFTCIAHLHFCFTLECSYLAWCYGQICVDALKVKALLDTNIWWFWDNYAMSKQCQPCCPSRTTPHVRFTLITMQNLPSNKRDFKCMHTWLVTYGFN